jgi:hypothetical protein
MRVRSLEQREVRRAAAREQRRREGLELVGKLTAAIEPADLHWLSGILEGEGSFGVRKVVRRGPPLHAPRRYNDPIVQLSMTDEDVVRRAAALLGSWCRRFTEQSENRKPRWATSVVSGRAAAWMTILCPLMGSRRQERIREVLAGWEVIRHLPRGARGEVVAA